MLRYDGGMLFGMLVGGYDFLNCKVRRKYIPKVPKYLSIACAPDHCPRDGISKFLLFMRYLFLTMKSLVQANLSSK